MKVIEKYKSAHINNATRDILRSNWDINKVEKDQSVLFVVMYDEDYDSLNNVNKIVIKIGGDQFNCNEGTWNFLSLLKVGTIHHIPTGGIHLVLKVRELNISEKEKDDFLKEVI